MGWYRIRLIFGVWTIQYFDSDMKNTSEVKFESYNKAQEYANSITEYMDADKSDMPVGDGKTKSGNLA